MFMLHIKRIIFKKFLLSLLYVVREDIDRERDIWRNIVIKNDPHQTLLLQK
jgi:hypothetical protein